MKVFLRILMSFCLASHAVFAATPPDWAKNDKDLAAAYKTGDQAIIDFLNAQYTEQGEKGVKDPAFKAQLKAKVNEYNTAQKAKVKPKPQGGVSLNPNENGAGNTEAGICPDCDKLGEPPISPDKYNDVREVVRTPPPAPVAPPPPPAPAPQSSCCDSFNTSNLLWGLGGALIGGLAGYYLGKNNSSHKYSAYPQFYGNGGMYPGYNPYLAQPYYSPRFSAYPPAYPAPGFGGPMMGGGGFPGGFMGQPGMGGMYPPQFGLINNGGFNGFNGYNGFNGGAFGGYAGLSGAPNGGMFGPAPIVLPYPGPSFGVGAVPYGFR